VAVVAAVLAACCFADWLYDIYADVPFWLRPMMTAGQALLAVVLVYVFLVRSWVKVPPIDDLASRAERAIPEFDHRLVTALQLNRRRPHPGHVEDPHRRGDAGSRRHGVHHNLLRLVDYRRFTWAIAVVARSFSWPAGSPCGSPISC